jgi:hypothetical protein
MNRIEMTRPTILLVLRACVAAESCLPSRCLAPNAGIYFTQPLPSNDRKDKHTDTQTTPLLIVVIQLFPWEHVCLRRRYLALLYICLSRCRCPATGLHATIYYGNMLLVWDMELISPPLHVTIYMGCFLLHNVW